MRRLSQREARAQVEGHGDGGQLSEVVDGERTGLAVGAHHRFQRHQRIVSRPQVELGERLGRALILRQHLQDHLVLVGGSVDHRNLACAVGAEERVLHLVRRDAQRDGAVAVDIHHHLRAGDLHVAADVHEPRQGAHFVGELWRPLVNLLEIHALQGHLVGGGRILAAHRDGRRVLHEHHQAGNGGDLGAQLLDNLVYRVGALLARLHVGEHERLVASHHEYADMRNVRMRAHDFARRMIVRGHPIERGILRTQRAGEHEPAILAGDEAGGHGNEQVHSAHQHENCNAQRHQAKAHGDAQSDFIRALHQVETTLEGAVRHTVPAVVFVLQVAAAQHGRERQRYETGDQDGHHDGHGKLMQQAPHDAAHEQHRNEDGDQRKGHGENGEADLARGVHGGFEAGFAHLHVAHDIFQHDDGVVHHETHGEGQRHQREVVEAVAQQVHYGEGSDDGERHRAARDQGGGEIAQEKEDHQDDDCDGEEQGELHVVYRAANGL